MINRGGKRNPPVYFSTVRYFIYLVVIFGTLLLYLAIAKVHIPQQVVRKVDRVVNIEVVPPSQPPVQSQPPLSVPILPVTRNVSSSALTTESSKRIAIAITVTKDGPFLDGALVLGYAAKKYHSAKYASKYFIDLIAFVTKKAVAVRPTLIKFGWKIYEKDLPVALDEIKNQEYAQRMRDSGCCGADEFLKLWAYTLTEYHKVLHLDMDCIIFKNLDSLFDSDKELLYTGDYNMKGGSPVAPAQGGFLVIKPSMEAFTEFQEIIRKGDHGSKGWGGSRIGNFWGGQTIQGIMPYFYTVLHPERGAELNRCQYNQMADNPYYPNSQRCINKQPTCEDCRLSDPETVYSAHFTICQKPWTCTQHVNPKNMVPCLSFHKKWFELRDEFEKSLGFSMSHRSTKQKFPESLGMCSGFGDSKYIPLPVAELGDRTVEYP